MAETIKHTATIKVCFFSNAASRKLKNSAGNKKSKAACKNCGKELKDEARFCNRCGTCLISEGNNQEKNKYSEAQ